MKVAVERAAAEEGVSTSAYARAALADRLLSANETRVAKALQEVLAQEDG